MPRHKAAFLRRASVLSLGVQRLTQTPRPEPAAARPGPLILRLRRRVLMRKPLLPNTGKDRTALEMATAQAVRNVVQISP